MSYNLVSNLVDAIRGGTEQVRLRNLERKGYKTVTVLQAKKLDEIVSRAVECTLTNLGLPLDADAVRGLSNEAKTVFVQLVRERDLLRQTNEALEKQRRDLTRNEDIIRHELKKAHHQLVEEKTAAPVNGVDTASLRKKLEELARKRVEERIGRMGSDANGSVSKELATLAEELASDATVMLDEANTQMVEHAREQHAERVSFLERRIRKLQTSLSETEAMLLRAQSAPEIDDGVPSLYREVQGLSEEDSQYRHKRDLLKEIFQLNVELRHVIQQQAGMSPVNRQQENGRQGNGRIPSLS